MSRTRVVIDLTVVNDLRNATKTLVSIDHTTTAFAVVNRNAR